MSGRRATVEKDSEANMQRARLNVREVPSTVNWERAATER